jgi:crotonobetainyl-CoA:carnitine CoA-transferase CaiB-like acyl-CoA transferase
LILPSLCPQRALAQYAQTTEPPAVGHRREGEMEKALAGLRVLDFTTTIAGPHCTRLLADLGADVVKVEAPEGDMMRSRPPLRNGASSYFGQLNAGKKSVVLDLKIPSAVAAARRLAASVDILVENYRPGVMQRLGLDYAPSPIRGSSTAPSPATARPAPPPTSRPTHR